MLDCALLSYLRYQKQIYFLSTEFPYAEYHGAFTAADIAGLQNDQFYEFEIKTSWSDFKADFKKEVYVRNEQLNEHGYRETIKILKHDYIKQGRGPHKFWFCFPSKDEKLIKKAKEFLKINYPKYGIIAIGDTFASSQRAARKLHTNVIEKNLKEKLETAPAGTMMKMAQRCLANQEFQEFKKLKRKMLTRFKKKRDEYGEQMRKEKLGTWQYESAAREYNTYTGKIEFLTYFEYEISRATRAD